MATFLFVVPPYFGHINPTLGVGAALISRGHNVIWLGLTDLPQAIFPDGAEYILPEEFRVLHDQVSIILSRQEMATKHTANRMIKWAFEAIWLPYQELMHAHLPAILARIKPDFIFYDEGLVAVAMAAHQLGIPYATSISSAPGLYYPDAKVLLPDDAAWLKETMDKIKFEQGISTKAEILNSPSANIVYSTRNFVKASAFPENYYFVGPAHLGRPSQDDIYWNEINFSRKSIYISTGTLLDDVKKDFYLKVITAFCNQDITVLITAAPDMFESWPDNFIARARWPQLDVLSRVSAVISHGGFNTVNESLYFGKPLLIIPMAVDQFGNADLVENSGCGLRLRYKRLSVADLQNAVHRLLTEDQFRLAAETMMQEFHAGGGAIRAADVLVEQLEWHHQKDQLKHIQEEICL